MLTKQQLDNQYCNEIEEAEEEEEEYLYEEQLRLQEENKAIKYTPIINKAGIEIAPALIEKVDLTDIDLVYSQLKDEKKSEEITFEGEKIDHKPILDLVKNENTSAKTLKEIIYKLPLNTKIVSPSFSSKMFKDQDYNWTYSIFLSAILNKNLTDEDIMEIATNGNDAVKYTLIIGNHNRKKDALILKLINDQNIKISSLALKNKCVPEEILETFADNKNNEIQVSLCLNPNTSANALEKIFNNIKDIKADNYNHIESIKCHIAKHNNTSMEILQELITSDNSIIRDYVMQNEKIQQRIFSSILRQQQMETPYTQLYNTQNKQQIKRAIKEGNPSDLEHLAQNVYMTTELLLEVLNHPNITDVVLERMTIWSRNTEILNEIINRYEDKYKIVANAIRNDYSKISKEVILKLLKINNIEINYAIYCSKNTPQDIKYQLEGKTK